MGKTLSGRQTFHYMDGQWRNAQWPQFRVDCLKNVWQPLRILIKGCSLEERLEAIRHFSLMIFSKEKPIGHHAF
jgi:hypothetical protein